MTQLWQTCGRVSRTFSTTIPEGSHYVNSSPFRRNGAILTIDNDAILIIDIAIKQTTIVIQSLVYSFPPKRNKSKAGNKKCDQQVQLPTHEQRYVKGLRPVYSN